MTNLRKWLTGQEVMKKLNISRLDLFELVKSGKLSANDPDTGEKAYLWPPSLPAALRHSPLVDLTPDGIQFLETKEVAILSTDLDKCFFSINDVDALKTGQSGKKSNLQEKWDKVRVVAKELWDKDPKITIEDMAFTNEVTEILGRNYTSKTIRDHIKDLCPNNKPGRRPTKK